MEYVNWCEPNDILIIKFEVIDGRMMDKKLFK